MVDGVIQPEVKVNMGNIAKAATFGENVGTQFEQQLATTLRNKKEAQSRTNIAETRKQIRETSLTPSQITELQGRFTSDATPLPDGRTLDVAARDLTNLYDRYMKQGYAGITDPGERLQIDTMIQGALTNSPDFKGSFRPGRISQIAEDPRVRLQVKRSMKAMAEDKGFKDVQDAYLKDKGNAGKRSAYLKAQEQNFGRLQSFMTEGAENYLDGETELLFKDFNKTQAAEYAKIQQGEVNDLYRNLREKQRTDGKLDKGKVNKHWRDFVDNGPEDIMKQLGYTDPDQIKRLSPHISKMVIDRKMHRTWWPPKAGEIKDLMETPWGQEIAKLGEKDSELQQLLSKAGVGEGIVRFVTGKGKNWRGRTGGLALAALVTAAALASQKSEDERVNAA